MKYLVLSIFSQYTVGMLWYGLLFKDIWIAATGISPPEIESLMKGTVVHLWPILFAITNTIFLEMIYRNTATRGMDGAMRWAFLLWLMTIFPASLHHHAYQGRMLLAAVDGFKDLFCCLIAGVVVGLNNKKAF